MANQSELRPFKPGVAYVEVNSGEYEVINQDVLFLAREVVARVLSVYREEYIAKCVSDEPESLLALVKHLEVALNREMYR